MTEKKKAAKPKVAGEKKAKKPKGPVTYADHIEIAGAATALNEIAERLEVVADSERKVLARTVAVLQRRISGLSKTVNKIETAKERGAKTVEKALERLNAARAERGLPPKSLDEFLRA